MNQSKCPWREGYVKPWYYKAVDWIPWWIWVPIFMFDFLVFAILIVDPIMSDIHDFFCCGGCK